MDMISVALIASPSDELRALIAELEEVLAAEYPPEQRHGLSLDAIFQPHIRFFIARVDGRAVGCGGVALFLDFAEVKRMYVRPEARGRAVLRLETGDRQLAAMRFYERAGFRHCGAFGAYAAMPRSAIKTSVFYEKAVAPA
jgi:putative acetyltransferase